jgi:hypothetical protein
MNAQQLIYFFLIFAISLGFSRPVNAHCDSMDGPVVKAAINALDEANVNYALIWVHPEQENEIRVAFERAMNIRHMNEEVQEVADLHFFETLVRLHRASEGAPYTGLKPAGTDPGPVVTTTDLAIQEKSGHKIMHLLTEAVHQGIHIRFQDLLGKSEHAPDNVQAGREFVKAYVEFIHFLEPVYHAATRSIYDDTVVIPPDHH